MAGELLQSKVLFDKENQRVVFAESDKDLVDVLFSFLTMPIGTAIRLIRSHQLTPEIGCLKNLYQSVENLELKYFQTTACKTMLLHPQSAAETHCRNLKFGIDDDLEPTKYYRCEASCRSYCVYNSISNYANARCTCGGKITHIVHFVNHLSPQNLYDIKDPTGGFVKETVKFIISDSLQVIPMSTRAALSLLNSEATRRKRIVQEKLVNIKASQILMSLLICKTPLTFSFLLKDEQMEANLFDATSMKQPEEETDAISYDATYMKQPKEETDAILFDARYTKQPKEETDAKPEAATATGHQGQRLPLKLILRKTDRKVIYAEASEDIIDLIFSYLTLPLGSIVELLGGVSPIQCLNNLYNSAKDLDVESYFKSNHCKDLLLQPKLAPYYKSDNLLLEIEEALPQQHYTYLCKHCFKQTDSNFKIETVASDAPKRCWHGNAKVKLNLINPKLLTGDTKSGGGFMKGPAMFMVTDDLVITPLSIISGISLLESLNVSTWAFEEQMVYVGKGEALNLLKASVGSKMALTNVFSPNSSNVKQERG